MNHLTVLLKLVVVREDLIAKMTLKNSDQARGGGVWESRESVL